MKQRYIKMMKHNIPYYGAIIRGSKSSIDINQKYTAIVVGIIIVASVVCLVRFSLGGGIV